MNGSNPAALIVNDDRDLCEIIGGVARQILTDSEFHTASSESEAYAHIEALGSRINLAIVDLCLVPGDNTQENGMRVLQRLHACSSEIFTILVSMKSQSILQQRASLTAEKGREPNRIVSLRYTNDDPIVALQDALNEAKQRVIV